MWLLPMIAERAGDPLGFVERTIKGEVGYDSPEWIEAFQTIADLRTLGRPARRIRCHGLRDHAAPLPAGKGSDDVQRLVAPRTAAGRHADGPVRSACGARPPRRGDAQRLTRPCRGAVSRCRPRSMPAATACTRSSNTRVGPRWTRSVAEGLQSYSPIAASNVGIHDAVAREFLPLFDDAITSLNWLWEPEIDAEIGDQVQSPREGRHGSGLRREGRPGRRRGTAFDRSQLLPVSPGARQPRLRRRGTRYRWA